MVQRAIYQFDIVGRNQATLIFFVLSEPPELLVLGQDRQYVVLIEWQILRVIAFEVVFRPNLLQLFLGLRMEEVSVQEAES